MPKPIRIKQDANRLHGKEIEFRIRAYKGNPPQEGIADGNGILILDGPDEDGLYEAFIEVTVYPDNPSGVGTWEITKAPLHQDAADCLEIAEDGTLVCVDPSLPS